MEAILIDAFEFCRLGETREGEFSVADMPRLVAEAVDPAGMVRWSLSGGRHPQGHPQLTLAVAGTVMLRCQRCLTPYAFAIDARAVLVLAHDEAGADELEASLDDDALEVVAASRQFSVSELVEDEALLALPVSPRHDVCPSQQSSLEGAQEDKAPSPFAVLKNLKR